MRVLSRRDFGDIAETMFLRPQRPHDQRDFNTLLPWLTPLFVYEMDGDDWVRWSMPKAVGRRIGMDRGCSCCGKSETAEGDSDDFHVDTALKETNWWLIANGYVVPTPARKEGQR